MTNIIETQKLRMEFRGFTAVCDVDIKVKRHSVHALIGPNGAGKTTCFNLLTKFLSPTGGSILYNGIDITRMSPASVSELGMVRSFQISSVFPHLTLLDNVKVALQRKLSNSYHFWKSKASLRTLDDRATELLDEVGLLEFASLEAVELSYGRKRTLEIATTLALDPEVMLLDEPMAGMGREDIARTTRLIKRLAANRTVLMVEHNLSVVQELCDRITVLARGQVLAEGSYEEVSKNPDVITAYIGGGRPHG